MIRQRLVTAIILAAVLLTAIFYLPRTLLIAALGVLFAGGFYEWAGFAGHDRALRRLPYVLVGAALIGLTYVYIHQLGGSWLVVLVPAALWWVFALAWVIRYPTPVPAIAVHIASVLVLLPAWLALSLLALPAPMSRLWVLTAFVLVWAADTGAYFTGKALGRNKLAPAVSPGKTWEGVAGGVALSAAVAAALAVPLGVSPLRFALLAAPIALISVVGDLIVSLFKRNANLKDSGRLFPGHGGILDRIDSVCAAAPLLVLGLHVFFERG